eukprot:6196732-Pleurochrysis_carterae.AAC.1
MPSTVTLLTKRTASEDIVRSGDLLRSCSLTMTRPPAISSQVMQTIKEILKLNPFFKEQMQMILERSEIHEVRAPRLRHGTTLLSAAF